MLEVYRVRTEGAEGFANWLLDQPAAELVSRMHADDGTIVFLVKNSGNELDPSHIPGFGVTVKRLPHVRYNFEFQNLEALESILSGDDKSAIGADYIHELIEDSVRLARPVTARLSDTGETYVIVRAEDGHLQPISVQ